MKILFGTDNFYPNVNGAANFIYGLIKGLIKKGHDIYVIAPSKKFKDTFKKQDKLTVYGIRSVKIPKIIHPAQLRVPLTINSFRIKKIIEEVRPQVIHIQDHFMICSRVVKTGKKLGIPIVGTNHFMPENFIHYLYTPDFAKKSVSKLVWKQFINVYKNCNLITTPTKTAASLIKNIGLKNPIIPISCGVDLDKFKPKLHKISNSKPKILSVGRLDKEKRVDVLIKAFSKVLPIVDAELIIAGKGKEKSNLLKLTQKLGMDKNISFLGFVPDKDLPNLYRTCDVFAIAGIAELQSIATLEAMASGLPVVAAKVMALPELVHDGENGYLFDQGDFESLARYLVKLLKDSNLRKKMSVHSLKIIRHHNMENTVRSYEKIYMQVLERSR